jgi:hypothetical protein
LIKLKTLNNNNMHKRGSWSRKFIDKSPFNLVVGSDAWIEKDKADRQAWIEKDKADRQAWIDKYKAKREAFTKSVRDGVEPEVEPSVVDKDELKRAGKAGEVERRGGAKGIVGAIKGRLAERAGKTETKTRRLLGRTWKKTKKYDEEGRKIGKQTEVTGKGGDVIRTDSKGDII